MPKGLKLIATETEDMNILSAALAGTITSPGEMSFLRPRRAFTLTGSRFMWENIREGDDTFKHWYRTRSGLYFGDILSVKATGISQQTPTEVLELLSMSVEHTESDLTEINLIFANKGSIRLTSECINVTLTDVGDAWHTDHKPQHENDEKAE
jgi:hypothetical protein